MKTLLKLEELLLFVLGIAVFVQMPFAWWWFLVLILLPDIGMLGYLVNDNFGAIIYNLFHHRGLAILIYLLGQFLEMPILELAGVILFAHIAMDRFFGYGLKYKKGFKYTHLGEIGERQWIVYLNFC